MEMSPRVITQLRTLDSVLSMQDQLEDLNKRVTKLERKQ